VGTKGGRRWYQNKRGLFERKKDRKSLDLQRKLSCARRKRNRGFCVKRTKTRPETVLRGGGKDHGFLHRKKKAPTFEGVVLRGGGLTEGKKGVQWEKGKGQRKTRVLETVVSHRREGKGGDGPFQKSKISPGNVFWGGRRSSFGTERPREEERLIGEKKG